jgi:hypothetical protein
VYRLGFEPEITAKIAKKKPSWRIYEEGKKIGRKDAFNAL